MQQAALMNFQLCRTRRASWDESTLVSGPSCFLMFFLFFFLILMTHYFEEKFPDRRHALVTVKKQ